MLESSRAWTIFIMLFISSFEIIEVVVPEPRIFFWISASIAEAAAVIPNKAKAVYAKRIATFINGPASLLNNDAKKPPYWIILKICALESFKSADILLLNRFLSFVFRLVVSNSLCARSFKLNILNSFSELCLFYFWQLFLVFLVAYLSILNSLYCIQPFICSGHFCCSFCKF